MIQGWHYKLGDTLLEKEILRVVNYWWPKATAFREGQRWLVLSREELQEKVRPTVGDQKASLRSLSRAMTSLQEQDILVVERHRHPFKNMNGAVWWMLPNDQMIGAHMQLRVHPTGNLLGSSLATSLVQSTDIQKTDGQEECGKPQHPFQTDGGTGEMGSVKGVDFLAKKKAGANIGSAMEAFDKKQDVQLPSTAEKMHKALRAACIAAGYPAPGTMNAKRAGQCKTMINRMGEEGLTPEEKVQLLFFVCRKWPEFIGWAKLKFNVSIPGTAPNHDALTLYAVEAVGFWRGYSSVSPVKETTGEYGSSLDEGF